MSMHSSTLTSPDFVVTLRGFSEITDEIANAFFEAGCDDGLLTVTAGVPSIEFCREPLSKSVGDAIDSIRQASELLDLKIQVSNIRFLLDDDLEE